MIREIINRYHITDITPATISQPSRLSTPTHQSSIPQTGLLPRYIKGSTKFSVHKKLHLSFIKSFRGRCRESDTIQFCLFNIFRLLPSIEEATQRIFIELSSLSCFLCVGMCRGEPMSGTRTLGLAFILKSSSETETAGQGVRVSPLH